MTNYFKRTALGIGYAALFSVLAMVIAYVFRLVLARNLTPDQFGLFYAVLSAALLSNFIREPGLKNAVVKFLPAWLVKKEYKKINLLLTQTLITWIAGAILVLVICVPLSGWLAREYFRSADAQLLLIVLLVYYLLNSFDYLISYVFQAHQRIGIFASVDFVRVLLFLLLTLAGFMFYPGNVLVPAIAYVATSFVLIAVYLPVLWLKVDSNIRLVKPKWDSYMEAIRFGLPVTLTSYLYTGLHAASILILTYFQPLAEVGLFNIALPTSALLINLATSISIVVFPLTAELSAKGMEKRLEAGASMLYRYTFIAILPLCLTLFMFADLIIVLLFGDQYLGATAALQVLAIGTIFWILASLNFNILAGLGKSHEPLKIVLWIAAMTVVLNLVLIPLMGIVGAALAISAGYVAAMILSITSLRKYLRVRVPFSFWVKGTAVALIFVGILSVAKRVVELNPYVEAVIVLLIASTVYVGLLFALRLVTYAEISSQVRTVLRKDK